MQTVAVFVALLAAASASTIFRVPSADSASISSQRVGGNFAYSVAENEAYGVVNPIVSHVTSPVATTYSVQPSVNVVQQVPQQVSYTVQQPSVVQQVATTYAVQPQVQQQVQVPVTQVVSQSSVVDDSSPIIYKGDEGLEKQINQVQQVQTVQQVVPQVATTYAVQPQVQVYAPSVQTYAVQPQQVVQQVQVPQVQVQQQVQQVQVPQVQTYSVQQPTTVQVQSGTPVTYNTVAGVSPVYSNIAYGYGFNTLGQNLVYGVNTLGQVGVGQTVLNGVNTNTVVV